MKFKYQLLSLLGHSLVWLYDIKRHFILICDPHAQMDPIIKRLSPSLLLTVRAGEGGCDVTARGNKSLFTKDILYVFE